MPSTLTRLACGLTLGAFLAGAAWAQDNTPKPATEATKQVNAAWRQRLDFANTQDFEDAKAGFIAPLPDSGVVKNAQGTVVWDPSTFNFIALDAQAPDTVNPSLWRMSQLLSINGLFKIAERIYQVRGYDLSVITFIEGQAGVIVVDPLVSAEPAAAALAL
jgi:alkyl sulfatase BDS1-like metallo-beta-lactamase superfamily hydrolase